MSIWLGWIVHSQTLFSLCFQLERQAQEDSWVVWRQKQSSSHLAAHTYCLISSLTLWVCNYSTFFFSDPWGRCVFSSVTKNPDFWRIFTALSFYFSGWALMGTLGSILHRTRNLYSMTAIKASSKYFLGSSIPGMFSLTNVMFQMWFFISDSCPCILMDKFSWFHQFGK